MMQIKAATVSRRHPTRYTIEAGIAARAGRASLGVLLLAAALAGLGSAPPAQAQTSGAAQGRPQELPLVDLAAGVHRIRAMVARTPEQRATGLMFRTEMAANEGMLFVFDQPQRQCFWMMNTLIPLSIAFLEDDGTIVNLDEMKPRTTDNHCSARPVRYVLEMNAGWFTRKGLRPGDRLGGGPFRTAR